MENFVKSKLNALENNEKKIMGKSWKSEEIFSKKKTKQNGMKGNGREVWKENL